MPVYEAYCRWCEKVLGTSKDIPSKDYYKLYIGAQKAECGCEDSMASRLAVKVKMRKVDAG